MRDMLSTLEMRDRDRRQLHRPDHRERCRAECTRDVIFLLQKRKLQFCGSDDGWEFDDDCCDLIRWDDEREAYDERTLDAMLKSGDTFATDAGDFPCVLEQWETVTVFLSREEGEQFAKRHEHHYRDGWRVYGITAEGELAQLLRKT